MKKFFIFLLVAVVVVIGVLMCQGTVVQESGDGSQVTGDYRSTDSPDTEVLEALHSRVSRA